MRLSTILRLIPRIEPKAGILERAPEGSYTLPEDYQRVVESLKDLLKLCRLKNKKKRLGFLALHTDGRGTYWFRGIRNYLSALNESLYSLETLADDREESRQGSEKINRLYRELSEVLGEL